jgi:ABC-type glycerol-3-phosphate transport system substrate-binding protein
MKKVLSVALIVLSISGIAFAGGQKEQAKGGPVTLDMWFQDWSAGIEITTEFANYIAAKDPNIKINIIPIPRESMTEKTVPAIMSKTEPDIIFGYTEYLEGLDYSKIFYPITPKFFSKDEAESKWYKNFLKMMEGSDGNYYGIPWGSGSDGWGFVLNNGIADKAGVSYTPGVTEFAKWDDVVKAAKKMTEYNPDGSIKVSGISMGTEIVPIFESFCFSLGANPFDPAAKKWDFSTEPCRKALDLLYTDLVKTQKVFDPRFTDTYGAFPKNIVGLACLGPWALGAFSVDYPELKMTYAPLPVPSDKPKYSMVAWAFWFFSQRLSGDKEQAAKFVARELAGPTYPAIQIEKWAGTPANKGFVDAIKSGSLVPKTEIGKINAKVAAKMAESFAPNIYFYEGTKVTTVERRMVLGEELSALLAGSQNIDATLKNITKKLNSIEENK